MNTETRELIRSWIEMHRGDVEGVARWMSRCLRIGGLKACRALVVEAAR